MSDEGPHPSGHSLAFVEDLYEEYLSDPSSVSGEWARYFASLGPETSAAQPIRLGPSFHPASIFNPSRTNGRAPGGDGNGHAGVQDRINQAGALQHKVDMLIRNYRVRGHLMACSGAVGTPAIELPELDPAYYGFTNADLDSEFAAQSIAGGGALTLREIIVRMQNTYCRSIGVQFMHIDDLEIRDWLQSWMESTENRLRLERDQQLRILTRLTDAAVFEEFIQKKYPGAKSFSLEGAESLLPLLELCIERAGEQQVEEIVFGMAHRGRLNVLANIMGKDPAQIFREYEDKDPESFLGGGDVKYHLGYHSEWQTAQGKKIHLALCFNPSHLEYVNPVALGRIRSWQDRNGDARHEHGLAILIHGDSAFAGEGIIQETLNLSRLEAYAIGGTLHIVVNNQIGFTTTPAQYSSTHYCTDVARMLMSPIFHVDGEDPEAVAQVVNLAMEYRKKFRRDVVIDMYCYRKRGHNEGDEPAFTQPLLYREIAQRRSVRENYLERLVRTGGVDVEDGERIAQERRELLEAALAEARSKPQVRPASVLRGLWSNYRGGPDKSVPEVDTGVEKTRLQGLLQRLCALPAGFKIHPKLEKLIEQRLEMAAETRPLDWSAAEALAFATLATEGARVRMTGQDCERGTFSHRHAVLHDYETGRPHTPLQHLSPDQAPVTIANSPLCEAGVLGFEYGYSVACPDGLVMWEAQFGDFVNCAQVIIDQFISTAEDKWRSLSGITLLLPHGFEGMGPEHSSARVERFLSLAAEDNFQVCIPSTPAQMFHLLRRQVCRPWRKPLVVMTPKSLLRHPEAVSPLNDFAAGRFQRIIPDASDRVRGIKRILLCAGKIYFDLVAECRTLQRDDVAIVRIEQLYPLHPADLNAVLEKYETDTPVLWVQEEPENMGAWRRMKGKFGERLFGRFPFTVASRPASASPAVGSAHSHRNEQKSILSVAFGTQRTSWY
jgi:2-oxoglutarate dehydrogenase E1 component